MKTGDTQPVIDEIQFKRSLAKEIWLNARNKYIEYLKEKKEKDLTNKKSIIPSTDESLIPMFQEYLQTQFSDTLNSRLKKDNILNIQTFQKHHISEERTVSITAKTVVLYEIFCCYLLGGESPEETSTAVRDIIKNYLVDLKDKEIIDKSLIDGQLTAWGYDIEDWDCYFACYFSLGKDHPDVALLKADFKNHKVELVFYHYEHPADTVRKLHYKDTGAMTYGPTFSNIFINVTNKESQIDSFISLVRRTNEEISLVTRFEGYYCSVLAENRETPVAGSLILTKEKRALCKNIVKLKKIPNSISIKLLNKRFLHNSDIISSDILEKYSCCYEVYWFLAKNNSIEIQSGRFEISNDGTCKFRDPYIDEQTGYIHQVDEKHHALRCSFDRIDDFNYRVTMTFDTKNLDKGFIDGVYSGQRDGLGKLMAGKIRLYKTNQKYEAINVEAIKFAMAEEKLGSKGKDLIDDFWGRDGFTDNFIQPNFELFNTHFNNNFTQAGLPERPNRVALFSGKYVLCKFETTKDTINQYDLRIAENGEVTYYLKKPIIDYKGSATFLKECLVISISERKTEPHHASYIFYLGGWTPDSFDYLVGIYATIDANDKAPICGRAVLRKAEISEVLFPIKIWSEDYYDIDDKYDGILKLLTGTENNLIKTIRKVNNANRQIDYDNLFYIYCCYGDMIDKERVIYLKYALDHGFCEVNDLQKQLGANKLFKNIKDFIQVERLGKNFTVKSTFPRQNWIVSRRITP